MEKYVVQRNDVATYLILNGISYELKINSKGFVDYYFDNANGVAKELANKFAKEEVINVNIKEWTRVHENITKECKEFKKKLLEKLTGK